MPEGSNRDLSAARIANILKKSNQTLAIAESCTGGLLGHLITNMPGSSQYFLGGVITYNNQAKARLLGVSLEILRTEGAVSAATVEYMSHGASAIFGSDWALAISGIAGPGGATADKPVGLVWIGVWGKEGVESRRFLFSGSRQDIKSQAASSALQLLLDKLQAIPPTPPQP